MIRGIGLAIYYVVRGALSSIGWSISNWLARRGL
jgi:hypothetical protein